MPAGLTNAEWEKIEELSKAELYKSLKQVKEKLAAYTEENERLRRLKQCNSGAWLNKLAEENIALTKSIQQLSAQVVGLQEALGNFVNVKSTRKLGKCKKCGQTVQSEQINYCYVCSVEIARELLVTLKEGEQ